MALPWNWFILLGRSGFCRRANKIQQDMSKSGNMSEKKSIFKGLGKATRRGVKKCPTCGTLNGTRALSCKNRSCDTVFKVLGGEIRKNNNNANKISSNNTKDNSLECCRLITDAPLGKILYSILYKNSKLPFSYEYLDFVFLSNVSRPQNYMILCFLLFISTSVN